MHPSKYGTASNSCAVNWSAVVSASMNASYCALSMAQLRYAPASPSSAAPSMVSLSHRAARKATSWSMDSTEMMGAMAS